MLAGCLLCIASTAARAQSFLPANGSPGTWGPGGGGDTAYVQTVPFTSTDPQAQLPDPYTFTAADQGTHRFPARFGSAGFHEVRVEDQEAPGIHDGRTNIRVTAPLIVACGIAPGSGAAPVAAVVAPLGLLLLWFRFPRRKTWP